MADKLLTSRKQQRKAVAMPAPFKTQEQKRKGSQSQLSTQDRGCASRNDHHRTDAQASRHVFLNDWKKYKFTARWESHKMTWKISSFYSGFTTKARHRHYYVVSDGNCHIGQLLRLWSKTFIAVWKGQILKYSMQYTCSLATSSGESQTRILPETRRYKGRSKKIQLATTKSQIFGTKPRMTVTVKPLLAFWWPHVFSWRIWENQTRQLLLLTLSNRAI